jgi:hypothetical protein
VGVKVTVAPTLEAGPASTVADGPPVGEEVTMKGWEETRADTIWKVMGLSAATSSAARN